MSVVLCNESEYLNDHIKKQVALLTYHNLLIMSFLYFPAHKIKIIHVSVLNLHEIFFFLLVDSQ